MVTVNVVVLAGRLSTDPEVVEMPSGDRVARLRLQVPETGKRVLPLPVAAWDGSARKGCERLAKGDHVMVRGRLVRRYFRGQGGGRSIMEVIAAEIRKLEDTETE
ncbi:MAG TPA: single-stranded DNA-binding protein [Actinomycetota bacterium]